MTEQLRLQSESSNDHDGEDTSAEAASSAGDLGRRRGDAGGSGDGLVAGGDDGGDGGQSGAVGVGGVDGDDGLGVARGGGVVSDGSSGGLDNDAGGGDGGRGQSDGLDTSGSGQGGGSGTSSGGRRDGSIGLGDLEGHGVLEDLGVALELEDKAVDVVSAEGSGDGPLEGVGRVGNTSCF